MALLACPDCGHNCSDQAPACPNCGRGLRLPEKSYLTKNIGCDALLYVLLIFLGLYLGFYNWLGYLLALEGASLSAFAFSHGLA